MCCCLRRDGSVVCTFKLKVSSQSTKDGQTVTELTLQNTLMKGFDTLTKSDQLTWPVVKITITGNF